MPAEEDTNGGGTTQAKEIFKTTLSVNGQAGCRSIALAHQDKLGGRRAEEVGWRRTAGVRVCFSGTCWLWPRLLRIPRRFTRFLSLLSPRCRSPRTSLFFGRRPRRPTEVELQETLSKTAFPAVFTYGLTTRITLFATVDQSLAYFNQHTASGDRTRSSSGFDDSLFFVRYTLLASQTAESLFRVTPFVGAYLPTGSYQKSDQYGRLPPFLQTGSGAVDPYFGWAGLMLAKQWGFQWDTTYRYNTPASPGFTLGDTLEADAHFGHLLYPLHLPDGTTNWLWAVVESNLYWYQPSRVSGRIDDYTGGTLWLIDPGLEYYSVQWVAACVIRVPLFEQWNQPGYPGPRVGFFLFYQYEFTMPHWLGDR